MNNKTIISNELFFEEVIVLLKQDNEVSFMVKGSSMKPFLNDETEVFLLRSNEYLKNDICLFKYKDHYLLHRLLKIKKNSFYFRGDNSKRIERVSEDFIYGKVLYYKKRSKTIKQNRLKEAFILFFYRVFRLIKSLFRKAIRRT